MLSHKLVYIYLLIDPSTNEIRYVGSTTRPDKRLGEHLTSRDKSYRTNWIKSLAEDIPIFHILQIIPASFWEEAEKYWISYFKSIGCPLTNHAKGGGYGNLDRDKAKPAPPISLETREKMRIARLGRQHSKETRIKMSKASLGVKKSEEHREHMKGKSKSFETREKISKANTGKIRSEEFCKYLSESRKGKSLSPLAMERCRIANTGRMPSEETRKKMSEAGKFRGISPEVREKQRIAMIGKKASPETCEKIRIANTGRKCSDETKAKLSYNAKLRCESKEERERLSIISKNYHNSLEHKAKTGRIFTEEIRAKMRTSALTRPPVSKETREKLSKSSKGKKLSPEMLKLVVNKRNETRKLNKIAMENQIKNQVKNIGEN
jgi:hypothetical protein